MPINHGAGACVGHDIRSGWVRQGLPGWNLRRLHEQGLNLRGAARKAGESRHTPVGIEGERRFLICLAAATVLSDPTTTGLEHINEGKLG